MCLVSKIKQMQKLCLQIFCAHEFFSLLLICGTNYSAQNVLLQFEFNTHASHFKNIWWYVYKANEKLLILKNKCMYFAK